MIFKAGSGPEKAWNVQVQQVHPGEDAGLFPVTSFF